jgi:pheromone shutdown-related protein TraB
LTHPEAPSPEPALPKSARVVPLGGGRTLTLVGTAHVSKRSVEDVAAVIDAVVPDGVCVELDAARHRNLVDPESWQRLDIFKVLREGKAALLLSSLVMASFQRRIAKELGVEPGAEMLEAVKRAEARGVPVHVVDRDIQVTLRRTWSRLGFFSKTKMSWQLFGSLFAAAEIDEETVEKLKEEDLGGLLETLAESFPQVKETLIDERDVYLAEKIHRAPGEQLVAVVGAGHVPGILARLEQLAAGGAARDLAELETSPPPSLVPQILQWAIPATIVALLAVGFLRGGLEDSATSIALWVGITGASAALGAAAAFGHPVSVLSAFAAAPFTSLHPLLASGWVAGLVQAWVKRPRVRDLESLPEDITTLRGFWRNPLCRILLVVALTNLAGSIGTFVAGSFIAARTL